MKLLSTLILLFILPIYLQAQTSRGQSEFTVSYGRASVQQWLHAGSGGGSSYTSSFDQTGNIFATYRYYLGKNNAIGLTAGIQHFSTLLHDPYYNTTSPTYYKFTTIAAEFLHNYTNHPHFRAYTYIGTGCSLYTQQFTGFTSSTPSWEKSVQNYQSFTGQYVPIGISAGGKLAAFLELGIGYKGVVNGGVSFRI